MSHCFPEMTLHTMALHDFPEVTLHTMALHDFLEVRLHTMVLHDFPEVTLHTMALHDFPEVMSECQVILHDCGVTLTVSMVQNGRKYSRTSMSQTGLGP